jgi:hypothetical protein
MKRLEMNQSQYGDDRWLAAVSVSGDGNHVVTGRPGPHDQEVGIGARYVICVRHNHRSSGMRCVTLARLCLYGPPGRVMGQHGAGVGPQDHGGGVGHARPLGADHRGGLAAQPVIRGALTTSFTTFTYLYAMVLWFSARVPR